MRRRRRRGAQDTQRYKPRLCRPLREHESDLSATLACMRQYPINIIEVGINKVIIATPVLPERIDRLCGGIKIAAIKALTLRVRCSGEAIDREWTPFGVDCPEYVRMQTPIGVIDIARQSVSAFIVYPRHPVCGGYSDAGTRSI